MHTSVGARNVRLCTNSISNAFQLAAVATDAAAAEIDLTEGTALRYGPGNVSLARGEMMNPHTAAHINTQPENPKFQ